MLLHRLADIDALQGGAQAAGELHGIVPGTVRGAEAGHGDGDDVAGRTVQERMAMAAMRMARVESSPPEAHHDGGGAGVLDAFLSPIAAIFRISSQRSARSPASSGTKGVGET